MSEDDQERLIAEALRAQAARTPLPQTWNTDAHSALSGYGLLSGSDMGLAPLDEPTLRRPVSENTDKSDKTRPAPAPNVHAGLIILLAVLLGLAAGTVVGLLTLV